jgi:hypothetical protein
MEKIFVLWIGHTDKRTKACSYKKKDRNIRPHKKEKKNLFSMQLFSAVATMFFLTFFAYKKLEKPPSKVAHNRHNLLFHSPDQPTAHGPELIFHIKKCREQASVLLSVMGHRLFFFGFKINLHHNMHGRLIQKM